MDLIWNKPVLSFYKDRVPLEKEPFVVVKAKKLEVSKSKDEGYMGTIIGFFPLMGDPSYIDSAEGKNDSYVLCWFDDSVGDFDKSFRRLAGVTFPSGAFYVVDKKGKRSYEANFEAKYGKLE